MRWNTSSALASHPLKRVKRKKLLDFRYPPRDRFSYSLRHVWAKFSCKPKYLASQALIGNGESWSSTTFFFFFKLRAIGNTVCFKFPNQISWLYQNPCCLCRCTKLVSASFRVPPHTVMKTLTSHCSFNIYAVVVISVLHVQNRVGWIWGELESPLTVVFWGDAFILN